MAISDLTDPKAVSAAMAEFTDLGRERFLQKYGFGAARTYFLVDGGQRYDSKAIVGAAHGFQHPDVGPLRAKDFSGGEATVRAKLQGLGFKVERVGEAQNSNPNWTREETILALDLYVRRRPQLPDQADREIVRLSDQLRAYAAQRGVQGTETFRNPNGVSMKVANLSRLDSADDRAGLAHGSAMEERVWAEFMPDLGKLRRAAEEIIVGIEASDITADSVAAKAPTAPSSQLVAAAEVAVSRGPAPSFGEFTYVREDGENVVYLMRLDGPVEQLFPQRDMMGSAVIKIGRSNDAKRRLTEMNCGFPPGLGLTWRAVQVQSYSSGREAHEIEQAIIQDLDRRGLAIGREFAIVPTKEVDGLLAKAIGMVEKI